MTFAWARPCGLNRNRPVGSASSPPASWAATNADASAGRVPAKVSEGERAIVIAGFAKEVEAVNRYAPAIHAATIQGTSCTRWYPRTTKRRPNAPTASASHLLAPVRTEWKIEPEAIRRVIAQSRHSRREY